MADLRPALPCSSHRDAILLAFARMESFLDATSAWSEAEGGALRVTAALLLAQQADAAAILGHESQRLVTGIALVPFLEPDGPFGPAWIGHPFASSAMHVGYKLREPDVTRELAHLMGPAAGRQGPERAVSLLRLMAELVGADAIRDGITDRTRPTVTAEHPVLRRRSPGSAHFTSSATRIDLLFEWPIGNDGRCAVVVIEAKLGAAVTDGQLLTYRKEAFRRARGGPVALILLTAWADMAERRYRAWLPLRWLALLRRWEAVLADAGDHDPEFARVRAHLWRFLLSNRKAIH